jgi:signal transduction histidine kinase
MSPISGIKYSLGIKFSVMMGVILLLFCALFSFSLYLYLRNQVIKEAEDKTRIIITQVKAVGGYVRETLRPKMSEILAATGTTDPFVIEAMSTTHVNLQVMKIFSRALPDYRYQRVSDRPLNSENLADEFHARLLRYFAKNPEKISWNGIVSISGRQHLVTASPVLSDSSCLACHQSRERAPRSLVLKYGLKARFGWRKDTLVGVESVSIPLDIALARVKKVALDTFTFGSVTLGVLFIALYAIFRSLVTRPLNRLSLAFRGIADGTQALGKDIPGNRRDEIGDVTASFNVLSRHLLDAEEKLKKAAELEKQMMETEKLASLGQLSAGVAHEINNPLGGMQLCFNNLMTIQMDEGRRKEHVDVINSGFDRIQNIMRHLLDFSKNTSLTLAPASLNRIAADVLHLVEYTLSRKKIKTARHLAENMPAVSVDANKLEQVFLNLIMNAVHAMEDGGTLTVSSWWDAETCGFSVSDTGRGIPADALPKIYDPFFSTKGVGEGTGLGLTVSKSIVEQHGGDMSVETSDRGATFKVSLPRTRS